MPRENEKLALLGAGEVGSNTLASFLRIFPKDKALDVVFFNRNEKKADAVFLDAEIVQGESSSFPDSRNLKSGIKVTVSSNIADLTDSDVVIFAIGVSAATTGATTRESALLSTFMLIQQYGAEIKKYAPNSTILVTINPSDIATLIMQKVTGFPPERVLGFGCELDARRFMKALREELSYIGISPVSINADVIGGHSGSNMIIPKESIIIGGMPLDDFKKKYPTKSQQIDCAIKNADEKMRGEGFKIVAAGRKAGFGPALPLARVAKALLLGDSVLTMCAQVLTLERSYFGIENGCLSVPLSIENGVVKIDHRYQISDEELQKLVLVRDSHEVLFGIAKSTPNESVKSFQATPLESKEQEPNIQEMSLYKISVFDNFIKKVIPNILNISYEGHSQIKVEIREGFEPSIIDNVVEYFKCIDPYVIIAVDKEQGYFFMSNNEQNKKILLEVGLVEESKDKSNYR